MFCSILPFIETFVENLAEELKNCKADGALSLCLKILRNRYLVDEDGHLPSNSSDLEITPGAGADPDDLACKFFRGTFNRSNIQLR